MFNIWLKYPFTTHWHFYQSMIIPNFSPCVTVYLSEFWIKFLPCMFINFGGISSNFILGLIQFLFCLLVVWFNCSNLGWLKVSYKEISLLLGMLSLRSLWPIISTTKNQLHIYFLYFGIMNFSEFLKAADTQTRVFAKYSDFAQSFELY